MTTSGNPILDKNLECIKKYNPKLVQDLLNLPCLTNNIELTETDLKEPNLRYNLLPLHSQAGAEVEAKQIFGETANTPAAFHVVFGIGLGYLFKECCEQSKGKVFLYEPNLEILRVTFELVDFSKELSQGNIFVTSDLDTFSVLCPKHYPYKAKPSFLTLNSYKTFLYPKEFNEIIERLVLILKTCNINFNNSKKRDKMSSDMMLKNIPYMLNAPPLGEFKNIYKGKTALVISAGPSLDTNIETIKKNRDKVIIFCVGTAFKALMKHGIIPDFVNIIENEDCSGQLKGFDLSEVRLISDTYTNNAVYQLKVKQNILFPSINNTGYYWGQLTGTDISQYVMKGSVSYQAIESAKMIGCTKIILVGQDLAYLDNKCYSSGSSYSDLICKVNPETNEQEFEIKDKKKFIESFAEITDDMTQEHIDEFIEGRIERLRKVSSVIRGIKGDMLPTHIGYATFVEHFVSFAYENKDLDLINTSLVGAQINGFKNVPLEEALKDANVIGKIRLSTKFEYDKKEVLIRLKSTADNLKNILLKFQDAKKYLRDYKREIDRKKMISHDAFKNFKKLLTLYDEINLKDNGFLYKSISISESVEVMVETRESGQISAEKIETEKIKRIFEPLKNYYFDVEEKIITTLEELEKTIKITEESISSEFCAK